jgi:hypothetical protein
MMNRLKSMNYTKKLIIENKLYFIRVIFVCLSVYSSVLSIRCLITLSRFVKGTVSVRDKICRNGVY